jgi:hypothetical protein
MGEMRLGAALYIFFHISCFISHVSFAGDCLQYKTLPSLKIKVPGFSVSIIQPDRPLNLLHGNVVATFAEEYEIEYGAQRSNGGWCVFIENITAFVGYTDFVVQIDKRHPFDGCEFNAIKEHEDEHIRAHLSVIDDEKEEIEMSIMAAADNILPVFIENESDIERAMGDIESQLQEQPQIKLLRQKLNAEQEIRNKKIDLKDRGWRIRACGERNDLE